MEHTHTAVLLFTQDSAIICSVSKPVWKSLLGTAPQQPQSESTFGRWSSFSYKNQSIIHLPNGGRVQKEKGTERMRIFHSPLHTPNVQHSQYWKPGARSSIQVPHVSDRDPSTWAVIYSLLGTLQQRSRRQKWSLQRLVLWHSELSRSLPSPVSFMGTSSSPGYSTSDLALTTAWKEQQMKVQALGPLNPHERQGEAPCPWLLA